MEDEYDDEANADLSLQIVAKAQKRQREKEELSRSPKPPFYVDKGAVIELSSEDDGSASVGEKRPNPDSDDQAGERFKRRKGEGTGTDPVIIPETPGNNILKKSRKKNKQKRNKSKRQGDEPEVMVVGTVGEPSSPEEGQSSPAKAEPSPADDGLGAVDRETTRKMKRKPRYFDPPEDLDAANRCFRCGEPGHFAADCTSERVSRPCYTCGEFTHEERNCPQASSCYICKDDQHLARDCPQKGDGVCLHCGGGGHTTSSCRNNYDEADLKAMQCYVCKQFGHLCCLDGLENFPTEPSCYNCGGAGHTGPACTKSRHESSSNGKPTPVCFKCESEGHYARDCTEKEKTPKPKTPKEKASCFKCGGEGHFARDCTRGEEKTPSQCFKCGAGGHFARDCNQANQTDQQCFKCGISGHFARDCNQADEKCYKCGREGHFARDCKKRWNSEADNDFPRRTKTPRSQEQLKEHKQYTPKSTNNYWKKPKPIAELVRENSAKKLPKWHEVER